MMTHVAALSALALPTLSLPAEGLDLRSTVEDLETRLILQALERTGWNKNRASRLLGLNRTTLVEMIKRKRLVRPEGMMRKTAAELAQLTEPTQIAPSAAANDAQQVEPEAEAEAAE
jgi:Bacterial regulatory protein, Fis family